MTQQRERARLWRQHGFQSGPTHANSKDQFSTHSIRYHRHWTTDPAQVDSLWAGSKWADSNVAIKCAPGFVIVDIDPRNGGTESATALGLLDADGMPTDGAYTERTSGDGWHIVYRLSDGLGRGLKAGLLAPGVELTFEDSESLVLVAPSIVKGRPYVTLSNALNFTPAPACIVEFAQRMQAARTSKPAKHAPSTSTPMPQSTKARYADATLFNICNELKNTQHGTRFIVLRRVACIMGSVCAACNTDTAEAMRQLEAATQDWKDPAKVKATIKSGLKKGLEAPAEIDWKHDAPETFKQAGQLLLDWLDAQTWNGVQDSKYGRVSRSTTRTLATAMADYSLAHGLYGAFAISVRTLKQLTGCCWQSIQKGLDALRADGTLSIVGRDEYAFIKAAGDGTTAGDKRLQARCYVFNLAEIGRQMAKAGSTNSTVIVHGREGEACASYDLPSNVPVTVLLVRDDTFSRLALGRSAGAVLAKLLAAPAGLNDAALAELTGLHVDTVGRAIGRLLLHGLVDCDGEISRAVDAEAIHAALAKVAGEELFAARREKRETIIKAERAAHGAYVQARRDGVGDADAQRLYAHVYNAMRYPEGQHDAIDSDGVITPANVTLTPIPGDYVNVWEQHAAFAQAKRDAAHIPTPTPEQISQAKAVANMNHYNERARLLAVAAESAALKAMLDDTYAAWDIAGLRTVMLE